MVLRGKVGLDGTERHEMPNPLRRSHEIVSDCMLRLISLCIVHIVRGPVGLISWPEKWPLLIICVT